jgi:hypothetical protein
VSAAVPFLVLIASEPKPNLMHECGRLQGLAQRFMRHLRGGKAAQLAVDKWEQFVSGLGITSLGAFQDAGHIAHPFRFMKNSKRGNAKCQSAPRVS